MNNLQRIISRPLQSAYTAGLQIFGFRPEGSINLGLKYLRKPLIGQYLDDYYPTKPLTMELLGNSNDKAYYKADRVQRRSERGKVKVKKGSGKMALKRAKDASKKSG
ncbi:hypothetical protein DFA_07609 [Cavenderia fasciculata]|uniref:Uncharacterized protein n=1 Tax=Cavenderia fasciculata TaxID=261658 RepID=F4Q645_CACFS|nr:uncharacterized protein DFA_07609 [Cavenderia fasciculata]EGG16631.1 hypothetical protein DFA_07609 [Cavenderia fasciculata]|eukprot:XP_004355105.1 hypothetical protein DFA_07609 [Cavenderia fasciculata]